ncbi:unnamed protein product, partial [Mesorhabditis belari]|uniref:Clustered mitochondria protein homolog n=1 Tax=Mesorhabditis belari TaxID=2138241 RepID=A0AAF3EBA5_9BILA
MSVGGNVVADEEVDAVSSGALEKSADDVNQDVGIAAVDGPAELETTETSIGEELFRFKVVAPNADPFELQLNSSEMFHEVSQVLLDRESTCHRTCFSLHLDGKRLDNFTEIRSVEDVKDGATLHVVEDPYTLREVRVHIRHLRELLLRNGTEFSFEAANALDGLSLTYLPSLNLFEKRGEGRLIELPPDYIQPGSKERPLGPLIQSPAKPLLPFINLSLSSYNPPIGPRKLKGDLLYIDVETVEKRRVHITSSVKGFYVNASTDEIFRPTPSTQLKTVYHSLVELLSAVSTGFRKAYSALIRRRVDKNVLERLPTPYPVTSWFATVPEFTQDGLRAEETTQPHRVGYEDQLPGQLRDWNEELQTTHEMSRNTIQERIIRDRSVFKIHSDFVSAALKGATAVVDGNVVSINPADDPKTHMFLWNDIFFSLGFDVKDHYKDIGGDAAAQAGTAADLQGVRIYSALDDPRLCTLGMAVIDYKGYRVTAQSIIPGILEKDQEQSVVYGSIDFGKTVTTSDAYEKLLSKTVDELKILPHEVITKDKDGKESTVMLYTSYETKGIVGNDSRTYVLDLLRTMPPDVNYMEEPTLSDNVKEMGYPRKFPHKLTTLRQELVEAFTDARYMRFIQVAAMHVKECKFSESLEANDAEREETAVSDNQLPSEQEALKIVDEAIPSKEAAAANQKSLEVIAKAAAQVGSLSDKVFDIRFNPDCFAPNVQHAPTEDLEKQRKILIDAGEFLLITQIPSFIDECMNHVVTPIDGECLCELMHSKGINVRYLGQLLKDKRVDKNSYLRIIISSEIVLRSLKHIIRKILQDVSSDQTGPAVAHLLNAFLGSVTFVVKEEKANKKTKRGSGGRRGGESKWADMSTKALWSSICSEADSYYGFKFDLATADEMFEAFGVQKVSLLRRLCKIMGIQLQAKDYQLEKKPLPFSDDDILNMYPIFRHKNPWARDAKNLYVRAQAETSHGRLREAYDYVAESVNLMTSVYGALHSELGQAMRLLARLAYLLGEPTEALSLQYKATLISERCNGIDHALTIVEYINLAHFAFANLYITAALKLLYRARYLLLLVHGENHPLMAQIDGNLGTVLYAVQEYDMAVKFLTAADVLSTAQGESKRLKAALLSHMMARAHSCRGDFRAALTAEKETYAIYLKLFGAKHERTRESGDCLKHLTQQAVEFQKRMHEAAKGNEVHKLLPLQAPPPMLPAVLEVLNALNGIIIISFPAATAQADAPATNSMPNTAQSDSSVPALQEEALD